jgi:hypothetical protein
MMYLSFSEDNRQKNHTKWQQYQLSSKCPKAVAKPQKEKERFSKKNQEPLIASQAVPCGSGFASNRPGVAALQN